MYEFVLILAMGVSVRIKYLIGILKRQFSKYNILDRKIMFLKKDDVIKFTFYPKNEAYINRLKYLSILLILDITILNKVYIILAGSFIIVGIIYNYRTELVIHCQREEIEIVKFLFQYIRHENTIYHNETIKFYVEGYNPGGSIHDGINENTYYLYLKAYEEDISLFSSSELSAFLEMKEIIDTNSLYYAGKKIELFYEGFRYDELAT